jgi:4-hydroxy-4-methyl-2-oxoglutarate aldolase
MMRHTKKDKIYLGAVYDAMYSLGYKSYDFYIDLKPIAGYSSLICGSAVTIFGRPIKKDENYHDLDQLKYAFFKQNKLINNSIILLQTNDSYCAHFGDITAMIYKKMGAKGFITDGNVRDVEIINGYNFPVFCSNVNPIDALDNWALIDFNIPIMIKNIDIDPADWIFASEEGIIRVKKRDIKCVQELLKKIVRKEENTRKLIESIEDPENLVEKLKKYASEHGRW